MINEFFRTILESYKNKSSFESEAQDRRDGKVWEKTESLSEEGMKAHALFEWLQSEGEIQEISSEEFEELNRLRILLEELEQRKFELGDEDDSSDLDLEIIDVEEKISNLEQKSDVYSVVPTGAFYDGTEFEVLNDDLSSNKYAVFTPKEIHESCEDYLRSLIDTEGVNFFKKSFLENYIDESRVEDLADNVFSDDVNQNPEAWLSDDEREISDQQAQEIEIIENKIERIKDNISNLEEMNTIPENSVNVENKIMELQSLVSDLEYEIEEIEESPEGDFKESAIQSKIEDLVYDAARDPLSFLENYGEDFKDYIDEDKLIEGIIEADGYGHTLNSYDGSAEEIEIMGKDFWVMRID